MPQNNKCLKYFALRNKRSLKPPLQTFIIALSTNKDKEICFPFVKDGQSINEVSMFLL